MIILIQVSGKPCAALMDLSERADSTKGWIDELPNAMNQSVRMELLCESFMPKTTFDSYGPQSLVHCKFMLHTQNSNYSICYIWSLLGEYFYQDHTQVYSYAKSCTYTFSQVFTFFVRKGGVVQLSKTTEAAGCQTE